MSPDDRDDITASELRDRVTQQQLDELRGEFAEVRKIINGYYESQAELVREIYRLMTGIQVELATLRTSTESRVQHNAKSIADHEERISKIERNIWWIKAWSAGAFVAVSTLLGAAAWTWAHTPPHTVDVILQLYRQAERPEPQTNGGTP